MSIPSTSGRLSDGTSASGVARRTIVFRTPPSPVRSMVSPMISDFSTGCEYTKPQQSQNTIQIDIYFAITIPIELLDFSIQCYDPRNVYIMWERQTQSVNSNLHIQNTMFRLLFLDFFFHNSRLSNTVVILCRNTNNSNLVGNKHGVTL